MEILFVLYETLELDCFPKLHIKQRIEIATHKLDILLESKRPISNRQKEDISSYNALSYTLKNAALVKFTKRINR